MKRIYLLLLLSCGLHNNTALAAQSFPISDDAFSTIIYGGIALGFASFFGYKYYAVRRDADKVPTNELINQYVNLWHQNKELCDFYENVKKSENKKELLSKVIKKANKPYLYEKHVCTGRTPDRYIYDHETGYIKIDTVGHSTYITEHYKSETAIFAGYVQFLEKTIQEMNDSFWYIDRRLSKDTLTNHYFESLNALKDDFKKAIPKLEKLIQQIKQHPQYLTDISYPYGYCIDSSMDSMLNDLP